MNKGGSKKDNLEGSVSNPWAKTEEDILEKYGVSPEEGLSGGEVEERLRQFGYNKLKETSTRSKWDILVEQVKSFLVILLTVAAVISFLSGAVIEGVSIAAVLIINTIIGFVTESKAVQSMESLKEMTKIDTHVRRDGEVKEISAEEIVPGDIVVLQAGDLVPADLRIVESSKLQAGESSLTGESVPVSKDSEKVDVEAPLAERSSMLYKGTHITRGTVEGVVVSTGADTELGKISESIEEAEGEETPLEKKLNKLAQKLVPLLLGIAAVVGVAGIIRGMDLFLMIETSIALAVAAVPEGLPIVATLALARGMWRMADNNALVNRLSSVETLGSTNIICTDKTGTLTENRMTVSKYEMESGEVDITGKGLEVEGDFLREEKELDVRDNEVLRESLEVGVLCNNASYEEEDGEKEIMGDPMEVSLLIAGLKTGIGREDLLESMPEAKEVSFDPEVKMMATYHQTDSEYKVAVKGAPEAVIEKCSKIRTRDGEKELGEEGRKRWLDKNDQMAEDGLRILALATKEVSSTDGDPYTDLTFLGLVAMNDPPREDVKPAIDELQNAGIRVIMATGDHAAVGRDIGYRVGLFDTRDVEIIQGSELKDLEKLSGEEREKVIEAPVFARVSPENKLDLIEIHQDNGSIVAMIGDGVNDAPALKKADIGITMGEKGTQVAKEAADIVLQDDNFSTITKAVEQGRVIFSNIRKFVIYLLSGNISQLLAIFIASLMGIPLPLLPLQILFLNVVNDVFPAFALGVGSGGDNVMDSSPRDPQEGIITGYNWKEIGFYGVLIAAATLGAFYLGYLEFGTFDSSRVVTISFLTLAFARLWHVFNMRSEGSDVLRNEVTSNKYVWGAIGLCTGLLLTATYLPGFSTEILKTVGIGLKEWSIILPMSVLPLIVVQVWKEFKKLKSE